MTPTGASRRVVIVLPRQAHLLDVAGPAQVFTNAAELTGDAYRICYVAEQPTITTHQGLTLTASTAWPFLDAQDLVIVPGWKTQAPDGGLSPQLLERIREHAAQGGDVASVCAGSLALAAAGMLAGRRATTHHDLIDDLRRFPNVMVEQDVLFTCEDRLHTSAGIASGIDLSLHLVAHDHGPAVSARVARTLVVPAWRAGSASQASVLLVHRDHVDDLVHRTQDILDDPRQEPLNLETLGRRLGVSGRTLARHFTAATGLTPTSYAAAVRREHASQLHDHGWTWQAAADAVGYADARSLRNPNRSHS